MVCVSIIWPVILYCLGWYKRRWRSLSWKIFRTVAALTILGLSMSGLSLLIHRGLYPRAQMGFTVVMLPTITILIRTLWDVAFGPRTEPQPNDPDEW